MTVSKVARKAYLSSVPDALVAAAGVVVGMFTNDGAEPSTGDGVYAGGGSLDGTVNAFIPGLSGRLVAGEGFESGFGVVDLDLATTGTAGTAGSAAALVDAVDLTLFLRPNFWLKESSSKLHFDAEPSLHELIGIGGTSTTECVIVLEVMVVQVWGVDKNWVVWMSSVNRRVYWYE